MLKLIGAIAVSGLIGYFAAVVSMKLSEHFGLWSEMELAGIIPMLLLGVAVFASVSTLTFLVLL